MEIKLIGKKTKCAILFVLIGCCSFGSMANDQIPTEIAAEQTPAPLMDTSVRDLVIPAGTTGIQERAYFNNEELKSVTIPSSVKTVGKEAFYGCTSLNTINIPSVEWFIELNYDVRSTIDNGSNPKIFLTSGNEAVIKVDGVPINDLLMDEAGVVTIPESVTKIGNGAFFGRTDIKEIVLPTTLTDFGVGVFAWCGLKSLTVPESVTTIPEYLLYHNHYVVDLSWHNNITRIGNYALKGGAVKIPFLPTGLSSIGIESFSGATFSDPNLVISENVTSLDAGAFATAKGLKSIVVKAPLKTIPSKTFYGLDQVTTVELPSTVTMIGESAFEKCDRIGKINMENVTSIGKRAFAESKYFHCPLPPQLETIADEAFYKTGYRNITIPATVNRIGERAFYFAYQCNVTMERTEGKISFSRDVFDNVAGFDMKSVAVFACSSYSDKTQNPLSWDISSVNGTPITEIKHLVIKAEDEYPILSIPEMPNIESLRIRASRIKDSAIATCKNLKNVCLKVPEIGANLFGDSEAIENVYVPLSTPPVATNSSFPKYAGVTLHIPSGTQHLYEDAEQCWWRFQYYLESDFSNLDSIFKADYNDPYSAVEEVFVSGLDSSGINNDIFNMQGICLKRNASEEDMRNLPKGIYIINGRKLIIR